MGNVRSVFLCKDNDVVWDGYVQEEWRSERARDLDKLGGLERPAIKRGDSMSAKLGYLQESLKKQGQVMESALNKKDHKKPEKKEVAAKFMLRTDMRAIERSGVETSVVPLSWVEQQEILRQEKVAARNKMFQYDRDLKASPPPPRKAGVQLTPLCQGPSADPGPISRVLARDESSLWAPTAAAVSEGGVAEWRLRIHRARRRVIMVVLTVVRLRGGFGHPQRMHRVDTFGFYIPIALGDEYGRFVEEQLRHRLSIQEAHKKVEAAIESSRAYLSRPDSAVIEADEAAAPSTRMRSVNSRRAQSDSNVQIVDQQHAFLGDGSSRGVGGGGGSFRAPVKVLRSLSDYGSGGGSEEVSHEANAAPAAASAASAAPVVGSFLPALGPHLTTLVEEDELLGIINDDGSGDTARDTSATSSARPSADMHKFAFTSSAQYGPVPARRKYRASDGSGGGATTHKSGGVNGRLSDGSGGGAPSLPPLSRPPRLSNRSSGGGSSHRRSSSGQTAVKQHGRIAPLPAGSTARLWGLNPGSLDPALPGGEVMPGGASLGPAPAGSDRVPEIEAALGGLSFSTQHRAGGEQHEGSGGGEDQVQQFDPSFGSQGTASSSEQAALPPLPRKIRSGKVSSSPGDGAGEAAGLPGQVPTEAVSGAKGLGSRYGRTWRARALSDSGTLPEQIQAAGGHARAHARSPRSSLSTSSMEKQGGNSGKGAAAGGGMTERRASSPLTAIMGAELAAQAGLPAVPPVLKKPGHVAAKKNGVRRVGSAVSVAKLAAESMAQIASQTQKMDLEASHLQRCEMMLGMHSNRANAAWADSQKAWSPGQAIGLAEQQQLLHASDDFSVYKADLVRKLRTGQIVFQFFAAEDELLLPCGLRQDLWSADPWALVAAVRPGSMPLTGERIEGLSLGARALTQLRLAVEALAGREAVRALTIVLHLHEGQRAEVLGDLANHAHYGLNRENVLIMVQNRQPGYRYDPAHRVFEGLDEINEQLDPQAPSHVGGYSLGTGYAMMQLGWVADAFVMDETGSCVALKGTVLEYMHKKGTEWIISRRSRDLALMSHECCLNVADLVQVLQLREKSRATLVTQAMRTTNLSLMRQMDSMLMTLRPRGHGGGFGCSPLVKRIAGAAPAVVELRCSELSSTSMVDVVAQARSEAGGELLVGLQRYAFHVPSLIEILTHLNVFRPKVMLDGATVRVALELSDLTSAPKTKCIAMDARDPGSMLMSPAEVEGMVQLLQAQDRDVGFRKVAGSARVSNAVIRPAHDRTANYSPALVRPLTAEPLPPSGQRIVIFCSDNDVTSVAVSVVSLMARAGRDRVFLVTVVPTALQQEQGKQLVMKCSHQLTRVMLEPTMDVVVKGYTGLLDCLESYTKACDATMVVMGSKLLTSQTVISGSTAVAAAVGSVTLSCVKRLVGMPVMVVTANTRLLRLNQRGKPVKQSSSSWRAAAAAAADGIDIDGGKREAPRVLAVVEHHSRPMMDFLCSMLMDPLRGDKLMLGQVFPSRMLTTQQQVVAKRLMEAFGDLAGVKHFPTRKMQLDGLYDKALQACIEETGPHVVALQLRPGEKTLPPEVVNLMRCSQAAVLLYRDRP